MLNSVEAQKHHQPEKAAIKLVLQQQQTAWNNGSIDSFMVHYWNNSDLRFVSKKGVSYGWQKVSDNYKKSYSSKEKMGNLLFDIKSIELIDKINALVVGSWAIQNNDGNPSGYFTLWLKKINGKWLIVLDHTS
jgi:hypothetical protein